MLVSQSVRLMYTENADGSPVDGMPVLPVKCLNSASLSIEKAIDLLKVAAKLLSTPTPKGQ